MPPIVAPPGGGESVDPEAPKAETASAGLKLAGSQSPPTPLTASSMRMWAAEARRCRHTTTLAAALVAAATTAATAAATAAAATVAAAAVRAEAAEHVELRVRVVRERGAQ